MTEGSVRVVEKDSVQPSAIHAQKPQPSSAWPRTWPQLILVKLVELLEPRNSNPRNSNIR